MYYGTTRAIAELFSRRPSVRPSLQQKLYATLTLVTGKQNTCYNGHHMCEYNDHVLAVAWWVILNSPDLYLILSTFMIRHRSITYA